MEFPKSELFEELAAVEHERWSSWQQYLFDRCELLTIKGEKNLLINANDFKHWQKQIDTPYRDLTEAEKDSDRKQVLRYWDLVNQT